MAYTLWTVILLAAALATLVSAHGILTSPQPRVVSTAFKAVCGEQLYNGQMGDKMGNIQQMLQQAPSQKDFNAAACNVILSWGNYRSFDSNIDMSQWLCKGYQFNDSMASVQKYTAGQVIAMTFEIEAPHSGTANVSIVNTATNSIIGSPLMTYADFASNTGGKEGANETSFEVTIPSNLSTTCSEAGTCVIQHYWDSKSAGQTYESCIDFTVSG